MVAAKTQPDKQDSKGKWMQRSWKDEKYTWTVSGVLWNNVKERCTPNSATQSREPSYCGAQNNFSDFQSFVQWNQYQIGYGLGYDLDSDILKSGDIKIYSESTCLLIPPVLNRFLQSYSGKRSSNPQGVIQYRKGFYVDAAFRYLPGETIVYNYRVFKSYEIDKARDYYVECKNHFAKIWVNRLKSGIYPVDEKVITYMENWEYKDEGE